MKLRLLPASAVAALIVAAAGCTPASGPLHNLDVVTLANGTEAYRVQCLGLAESSKACMAQVNRICGERQPLRVSSIDRAAAGFQASNDPHEIIFICQTPQPVAQSAPIAPPSPPADQPRTVTLNADTNFAFDRIDLLPVGKQALDRLIHESEGVNIETVEIGGHTDSVGTRVYNDQLSLRRAQTVHNYLSTHGLHAASYDVRGYGFSRPLASNATAEGRARNRRVEIKTSGITTRQE